MIERLGFLGAGTIAVAHAMAAREVGAEVIAACTRRPDSPNWSRFQQAAPQARHLRGIDEVLLEPQIDGIVVCLSWNVIRGVLPDLLKSSKPMLIEKPIASCVSEIPTGAFANKIVGYNRRFYEGVGKVKHRLSTGGLVSVSVTIPEDVERHIERKGSSIVPSIIEFSSSHVLDLLLYILGPLQPRCVVPHEDRKTGFVSYNALLTNEDHRPVSLALNQNDPSPVELRFRFDDATAWVLSPLERLTVFRGVDVREPDATSQIRTYLPKRVFELCETTNRKPGFVQQMRAFLAGEYAQAARIHDSRNLLQLIREIRDVGSLFGLSQTTRGAA